MDNAWGRVITENSVDQLISILRNHLEKGPTNPQVLVTHFGEGVSFEANTNIKSTKLNYPNYC